MKKVSMFLMACCFAYAVTAQVTDFSGSWKLNSAKSKLNDQFTMAPGTITIVQNGNELSMEKHSDFQGQEMVTNDKFTLDGIECVNAGFMDSQKKSVVTWLETDKTLQIVSKIAFDGNEINITEIYKMDGSNLVIDSKSSSSFGDMAELMVYDKL